MANNPAHDILRWRDDPVAFVREVFEVEPDDWQIEYLVALTTNFRIAAKACKGPGKTAVLAWAAWWFLCCYEASKIIATSITGDNLRDGLWTEMAKWQQKSKLLCKAFVWHAERITSAEMPEVWYMSARRWSKDATGEQQSNALAGLHADYIMFIIDEAGGVPDAVMAAAEAALANAGTELNPDAIAYLLIAGNPTHLSGPLYRACSTEASLWKVIEITGDPDDPKRSKRINIEWARAQIKKYGRDNPWVLVNVFGKFPPASINALLGPDEVEEAMKRHIPLPVYEREAKVLGVDCALGGADPSVIFPRQGLAYFKPKIVREADPKKIASHVAAAAKKWGADMIFVDNTGGYGSGVISWLLEWGYPVTGVKFSENATDKVYANKRTEMIHVLTYHIKSGAALPEDRAFKEALVAQTYTHHKDQLIMLPKEELKDGISDTSGFDMLDAAALTHAYPVMAKNPLDPHGYGRERKEYDPMASNFGVPQQTIAEYDPMR